MKYLILLFILPLILLAGGYEKVRITPEISYIHSYHKNKAILKIHRTQDTKHKLVGEYAITYRPNTYIQPIKIRKEIETIGEVELLKFIQHFGNHQKGLILDVRDKKAYKKESIPSAVNIPSSLLSNKVKMQKILKALGAKKLEDGTLDTREAMHLIVYSHGNWCEKSPLFIKKLLALGYPPDKMLYYRGGFQMWKILGFTTVIN